MIFTGQRTLGIDQLRVARTTTLSGRPAMAGARQEAAVDSNFFLHPSTFFVLTSPMPIIFGLDPSLRSTGYGIIQGRGRTTRALAYGVIKNRTRSCRRAVFVAIHQQITDLLQQFQPDAAAVEGHHLSPELSDAITLGSARGAALLALAERGCRFTSMPLAA